MRAMGGAAADHHKCQGIYAGIEIESDALALGMTAVMVFDKANLQPSSRMHTDRADMTAAT